MIVSNDNEPTVHTLGQLNVRFRMRLLRLSVLFLLVLSIMSGSRPLMAQSGAGSIQGTVADATGAAIPSASIHVVNVATGIKTDTKSNHAGFYQAPSLFSGRYSITVTAPGMKTYKTTVDLQVAQNEVINPVMTVGDVTEQVVVNASAAELVTQDSGTIGSTLENQRINQLPMDGRNILTLVGETTPGLETNGQRMNGQSEQALLYVVDGVNTENNLYGGQDITTSGQTSSKIGNALTPPLQLVDPDAIQEVKVQGSGSGAQYSTPSTVVMTTKSGTKTVHGTLFETARNNAFGVARTRLDPVGVAPPHLVRNEFGFSLGGPVVLPVYHDHDKSFWFVAYERFSLVEDFSYLTSVPTVNMRNGIYTGLSNAAGTLVTLYDPSTTHANPTCAVPGSSIPTNNPYCRTPYANNVIPSALESPLHKIYSQVVPLPTSSVNPLVSGNLTSTGPTYEVAPQLTFRLDHEFNENNHAFLRYTQVIANNNITTTGGSNRAVNSNGVNIPVGAAMNYNNTPVASFLASVGYTHLFSQSFFSETIVGQQWLNDRIATGTAANVNFESMLGLPNNFNRPGFPAITGQTTKLGSSQSGDPAISQIVTTVDENLTKIAGRHQLYFGGRYKHQRDADLPTQFADGVTFNALPNGLYNPASGVNYTAYANTGSGDASMFLGAAGSYTVSLPAPYIHYRVWELDGYFQDDFHMNKKLTFNLGVRYENHPPIWIKDGIGATFDLKNDAMVLQVPTSTLIARGYTTQSIITNDQAIGMRFETPSEAGMPQSLRRSYPFVFLPRFGFAYLPFSNKWGTVIRGAYGRYDFPDPLAAYVNHAQATNPFVGNFLQDYTSAAQSIDGLPDEQLRYDTPTKFPVAGLNSTNVVNTNPSSIAILPGVVPYGVDPDSAPQYVGEMNFTIEQPLPGHSVLRASYLWNHGTNLDTILFPNHHPTNYQWEMATGTTPPNGGASAIGTPTYSVTATGPYDQTTYGSLSWHTRQGWSNYNALQLNYQRLYSHGYAYQVTYTYAKSMVAGNYDGGNVLQTVDPVANYPGVLGSVGTMTSPYGPVYAGTPPPPRPAGTPVWGQYHALTRYELYQQDGNLPTMHIRYNWIVDLPVGRGKKFFGNSNRLVNELIGGFQIAGNGDLASDLIQPNPGTMWGQVSPLHVYKHKRPITDCRSGVCNKGYMWYNGYIAPSSYGGCTVNCVTGLPADYQPLQTWVNNSPGTTNYQTNDVVVKLANGTSTTIAYDGGPVGSNYLSKSYIHGPINWPINMSLFKVFPITDRVNLRLNVDAFNVFNMPGETDPGPEGVQNFLSSANPPRELQITARLTF
jgi:hypothetical protein